MDTTRFEKVYSQGVMSCMEVWRDRETGVHYLYHGVGNGGGMTVLLGSDGQPMIHKGDYTNE